MVSTEEATELLADVVDERSHSTTDRPYYDGCAAALEWVTGQSPTAPATGERVAGVTAQRNELSQVVAMLGGQVSTNRPRAYLSGVECTLGWVLGATDEPPI